MRLDYYVSNTSQLSRKEAKRAITAGRVRVDGVMCKSANARITEGASVSLDKEPLRVPGDVYLMMNKPAGVVSATTDSNQPTAVDLLPADLAQRVHIAGRLDKDTTGLLLLTSDGQWSHQATSPRRDCPKTYQVALAEPLAQDAIATLQQGILLKGEHQTTLPAAVLVRSATEIELTIREGRYHQVKRMLAAVGNHVVALHRQRIGGITLDQGLAPGQYRPLTSEEIQSVREAT